MINNTAQILDFSEYKALKEEIPVKVTVIRYFDSIDNLVDIYHLDDVFDTIPIYNPFIYVDLDLDKIKQTVARQGWYKKLYYGENGELNLEIIVEKV